MDNAGDHLMLGGRNWPCLQINLGDTLPDQNTIRPQTPHYSPSYYDTVEPVSSVNWSEYVYEGEEIASGSASTNANLNYYDDRFSEGGDFFYDVNNERRLDSVSLIAVVDTSEQPADDFPEDIELENEVAMEPAPSISSVPFEEQDGWYQDPYGDDFTNDINFMEDFWRPDRPLLRWAMAEGWNQILEDCWISSLLKRKVNRTSSISMIKPVEKMSTLEFNDHETIMLIMDTIKSRGQANEGVRMLHEFLLRKPQMDIAPYMDELDFYLKRFVVWGLNYYYNVDRLNKKANGYPVYPMNPLSTDSEDKQVCEEKMKKLSIRMLQGSQDVEDVLKMYWDLALDWFTDAYDLSLKRETLDEPLQ
ncbi:hypothetical protein O3M35_009629 [Rhynocoris fuscipes]|uniref:Uncharacterized protein n=1 Tax=Rhynocoris fuscipes TaxID=488301 RepID=A0AAW1D3N3_9HEMI